MYFDFNYFFVISYTCTLTFYSSLPYFIFPSPCPNPFSVNIMSGSGRWEEPSFTGMWTTFQWLLHWREWLALLQSPLTAHSSSVRSPSWVTKWWQDPSFASNQGYGEFMSSIIWQVQKTLHITAPWTLTSVTFCCLLWDVPSSSTPLSSPLMTHLCTHSRTGFAVT